MLRGICFIGRKDCEYKETIKNAWRKLEVSKDAAMSCKEGTKTICRFRKLKRKVVNPTILETTSGIISTERSWRSHRRQRAKLTSHCKMVHKSILMLQAMKIADAKAAVDKEWKKLKTIPVWQLDKVKSRKEVILEAQRDKNKVHFATLMVMCHLKNAELEPSSPKYRRTSRVPKWSSERRFLFLCSIHRAKFVCVTNDSSKRNGCSKIRWEILRIGEKEKDSSFSFFLKKVSSLRFDDHNFKKKNSNQLENFHSMLTNCLGMLVLKRQHFKRPVFAVWTITRIYKEFTYRWNVNTWEHWWRLK